MLETMKVGLRGLGALGIRQLIAESEGRAGQLAELIPALRRRHSDLQVAGTHALNDGDKLGERRYDLAAAHDADHRDHCEAAQSAGHDQIGREAGCGLGLCLHIGRVRLDRVGDRAHAVLKFAKVLDEPCELRRRARRVLRDLRRRGNVARDLLLDLLPASVETVSDSV